MFICIFCLDTNLNCLRIMVPKHKSSKKCVKSSPAKYAKPKSPHASKPILALENETQKEHAAALNVELKNVVDNLRNKDDYRVEYYFTNMPNQDDRDFVARVIAFYSVRTKRQTCPSAADVTAALPHFVQGITDDLNAATPMAVTYKVAKHFWATVEHISAVRNQHHNVCVNFSIDKSPFHLVA